MWINAINHQPSLIYEDESFSDDVIVKFKDGGYMVAYYTFEGYWLDSWDDRELDEEQIEHWMHIPEDCEVMH